MTNATVTALRHYVTIILALVLFAGVATVGVIGYYHVVTCINTNLGTRNAPSKDDADAHIRWAQNVLKALQGKEHLPGVIGQTKHYIHTLTADQAKRDAHPLGQC